MGKIADAIRGIPLAQQKQTQLLTLDREFEQMESKIQSLEAENLKLRAQVNPLQRDVDRLKNQLEQQQSSSHKQPLDKESEGIIELLAKSDSRMYVEEISEHLKIHPTKAKHLLNQLVEHGYVYVGYSIGSPPVYSLAEAGQEYAVARGFV